MSAPAPAARFGSGKAVKRVEDDALLTGRGRFADDVSLPRQAVLVFLRSPHPHARIASIDTSAARALPGVVAILTGADLVAAKVAPLVQSADFKRADGSKTAAPPQHVLAVDVVRYVGECVAAIVAETAHQARDAAEAIDVRYEPRPSVAEADAAIAPGAPLVWPQATGNVACEAHHGERAKAAKAFAQAKHTVGLDLVNQRVIPAPIEPRTTIAYLDDETGRLTLRTSCQTPTGWRDELAGVLGMKPDTIRVVVGDVGGGFGMKTTLYAEDVVAAYCARTLKRPVKWCAERLEEFLSASHGRDVHTRGELALDADGRILALRIDSRANLGAYATPAGVVIQLLIGPWVSTSIYDIPLIDVRIRAVLTHTTPTGPYRGAGRPEAIYFLERLMDAAARRTGIDVAELRRRNMIEPAQMPYRNPMAKTYDTGQFALVLDRALALADWNGFDRRAAESRKRGKLRGRGMATFLEWTGADVFTERVTVTVSDGDDGQGEIEMFSATQGMGQGLLTTYAQLAVDVFGVPLERIRIVQGDTDRGTGFGSAGSRSLFVGGSAVHVAANETVDEARKLAAVDLEAAVSDIDYRDGEFRIAGTDRRIGLFELARKQSGRRIVVDSTSSVDDATWPNGCHIAEVEIDPDTGAVSVDRYWSVNDVGRVVNPMIVVGQLEGGALQGIGQALCEAFVHDATSGQPITASFMDYALPNASMVRHFEMTMDESTPCRNNLLGVKGVGELGTIGATPTVVNAVLDALVRAGAGSRVDALQMPLTPERVWRALAGAT
ncbi:MAG TPA: xanthine dehydrogenase family protein molybdopterin-binding subunit [Casimicrobiaceae bacterium]|nr:xanthine dehydrogenase family protein molybdopterin-binding subunit [Casimicrobiaceae bacterium]